MSVKSEGVLPEHQHEGGDNREIVGHQLDKAESGSGRENPGPLDQQLSQVVGMAHLFSRILTRFPPFFVKTHQSPPTGNNQTTSFDSLKGLEMCQAGKENTSILDELT